MGEVPVKPRTGALFRHVGLKRWGMLYRACASPLR